MWGGSGPDPGGTQGGGTSAGPPSNQELIDLKDQFEQQQVLIAQLKEMLRKTEQTTVTQEKVEEYANTLTRMSARAKKSKLKREGATEGNTEVVTSTTTKTTTKDTPASEKIMLLRQQLEENKLKLAQRGKFQKGIEETVTQLKAQLDDSQQLISQTPLNLSLNESRTENYSATSNPEELVNLLVSKDRRLAELNAKVQKLEANVLDLQENVKEKDSVIDARTKAITLMSESLSKKGKNTLDALDDTKEQMRKMQENFVALEMEMKSEKRQLARELEQKLSEIEELQAAHDTLEQQCTDLKGENPSSLLIESLNNQIAELESQHSELQSLGSVPENQQKLIIELENKNKEIERLQKANASLEENCSQLQNEMESLNNLLEKYKNDVVSHEQELANRDANVKNLNNQTEVLNHRISELEGLTTELHSKSSSGSASRESPQRSSKKGKKGQRYNPKAKEAIDNSDTKIIQLQKTIDDAKVEHEQHLGKITEHEFTINELNLIIEDLRTKQEAAKTVVEAKTATDTEDVAKLKKQLDESNKNMIKIKAQHKGKIKELNKKIDELKKGTGNNEELDRLQAENSKLNERIDVLEEEKASLGLDANSTKDFAGTERVKELEVKLLEQSDLLDGKKRSITTLEEQIESYKAEIESLNERFQKLSHLENAQVVSEITSIHFEEQLDKLEMEKRELLQEKNDIIRDKEDLLEKLEALAKEKQDISGKLDSYMQENMELIDKLEKLSAEKVSSAESIEIVEGLTQQEKLELEAYQKSLEIPENIKNSDENLEQNPELNESVNQLTEETSDLLRKIELFTEERREVMEKMEALASDNNQLNLKIQEIENNRDILADTYEQLQNEKENLEQKLEEEKERFKDSEASLLSKVDELKRENEVLKEQVGDQEIKHGSEIEETVRLETVAPLGAADEQKTVELQKQIDEYKSLLEIQKQEIQELNLVLLSHKDLATANRELHEKISSLQAQYESLLSDNEKLNKTVKETSEIIHEKDAIESELMAARKRISEFGDEVTNNLNEIENYRSIIEENKDELISSSNVIADLQRKLDEKQSKISQYENEVVHLNSVVAELNSAVSHLENENRRNCDNSTAIELMSNQLQELKGLLNENLQQIEVYETELQQNSDTVAKLNTQLKELTNKMLETEHELECKDDEIKKLTKERDNKDTMISNLQEEMKQKDANFHQVCDTLKEKYLSLQSQIEQNAGSLDNIKNPIAKVQELENKNKEQLEKMKKIAANLKKKTAAYQELEEKYKQNAENWETEEKDKLQLQELVNTQETKIQSLLGQLHEMEKEFTSAQGALTVKTKEFNSLMEDVTQLKADVEELQNLKQQYELQLNALTTEAEMYRSDESNKLNMEINEKNEIIKNLTQQLEATHYSSETNSNALHAKIQELEMFIETQEAELTKYKDKVSRLEEGLSTMEERRLSLERKAVELGAQLQEKSTSYEEISQTEDILEQRLAALMVHDEKVERHLQEALTENQEVTERNRFLAIENDQLKHKLSTATERNLGASTSLEKLTDSENDNARLRVLVANLEGDTKRLHVEYDKKLSDKRNEIEAMEVELQGQLEQLDSERKTLMVQCEHLRDQLQEASENQEILKEDAEQYKQKLEQQQVDFDAHIVDYQRVDSENKKNLGVIEQLNLQLQSCGASSQDGADKSMQELEKLLAEKNCEIENYQRQNLQLQMQSVFGQSQQFDDLAPPTRNTMDSLKNNLQSVEDELHRTRSQLEELERINTELKTCNLELMEKVAALEKQNVDNKVTDKPQKSAQVQNVSTFVWPEETSNDPFAFVIDPVVTKSQGIEPPAQAIVETHSQAQKSIENGKDELLSKIKTLEFMLYNTEKENEDVLLQCQELTGEVARLIYEKQLQKHQQSALQTHSDADLMQQIVSPQEATVTAEDLKQLQAVEFGKTKPCRDVPDNAQPVVEDVLEPQTAYLCYQLEAPPGSSSSNRNVTQQGFQHIQMAPIESQIVSSEEANVTAEDLRQLHGVEFEKTKDAKSATDHAQAQPVLEDVAECKTTYLCYKPEKQPQEASGHQAAIYLDAFDENDDGWGCGSEEAKLEDDYRRQTIHPPLNQNLNLHVEELDDRIRVLELERERHLEEIKQAQIKSGKLIKKLKEFKARNEKLTAELRKSSDFGGLDDAIQDELKSQIVHLEKRMKESSAELEKEKADRNNLLKKIDVLQAANERMVEMKEKQDIDMLSWQQQNRELCAKLERFEWGDDGFGSPKHSKSEQREGVPEGSVNVQGFEHKIQELTDTIKELTLDNEELQAMLEEQRTLRMNAEKAKSVEPIPENMKTEAEYVSVVTERNNLNDQLALSVMEKKSLQEQLNHLIKSSGEQQQQIKLLTEEKSLLEFQIIQNKSTAQELTTQLQSMQNQNDNLVQASQTAQNNELQEAKAKINSLEQENIQLTRQLQILETTTQQLHSEHAQLSELQNGILTLNEEKTDLFNALQEKNKLIETLNESIAENDWNRTQLLDKLNQSEVIADENEMLLEKLQSKDKELAEITNKLDAALEERSTLAESLEQLAEEWGQRVDQRGTDVAESWKLHLESRESEFAQVEQQLRKELNELEEKCNALVNENNELRKNVDAEIRNEVDRISALQQQITDRQHYINDLTRAVQENQTELEQQRLKLADYDGATLQLRGQIQEKDVKIAQVEETVSALQLEARGKSEIIEELTQQLQEMEVLRQQVDGSRQAITTLQYELSEKQSAVDEYMKKLDGSDKELDQFKEAYTSLQQQIEEKDTYISEMTTKLNEMEKLQSLESSDKELEQYKEAFSSLQQQIHEKDTYISEITAKLKEDETSDNIKTLHQQITDLNSQLQEKNVQIEALSSQIYNYQQFTDSVGAQATVDKEQLNLLLQEKQVQIEILNRELSDSQSKESEVNQLKLEINNLKSLLNEKEKEYSYNLAATTQESESVFSEKAHELDAMRRRQMEAENHYDEFLAAKDSDMENLRLQLEEQMQRSEVLANDYQEQGGALDEFKIQLDVKVQECEELQNKVYEQNLLLNEENKQLTELRQIIEDQVLKIEILKQELFDKSKHYDSLIAEMDIRKPARFEPVTPTQEHPPQLMTQASKAETTSSRHDSSAEDDYLEPVSRAELDLALYMLHQRDVRCEELTVELMQLLEERDTLQLKLSNSIREKEDLRSRFLPQSPTPDSPESEATKTKSSSVGATPKSKASAIVLGATGTELAMEATESLQSIRGNDPLANKLSELKSVGYRRDKTLLDEQEQRRYQQLSLMQQHRDVAAMLPPEAAARLVQDASYTLSRDVQSPSKVLLNWLWGRSTPKVNNI